MDPVGDISATDGVPVQVRYWAAIRAAAGVPAEQVGAGSLEQVLASARALHVDSARFASVLSVCSVLVDEQPVGTRAPAEVAVPPGATVDLLPPFAGG
ncbi:MAG: MoaD/ThiS family protein [Nocardioidaceae bacterium]|jgi:molybdopterin converting factor small subunit|nr:MoaD/ThiS family protein [Nocardioidaceae bacterium]MDQ3326512.1 MoaD/ThiS family protein [Actinomycetota bacterium]MDQ3416429.1 MoaD/ThiS family protein [Actinomycetota bacterium]